MWSDNDDEYLGFADDSQVSNPVWRLFLVMLALWCLASLFGCATFEPRPAVNYVLIGNQVVTEYTDATDAPETCGGSEWVGCYTYAQHRIDYKSPVAEWTKIHERAHEEGFKHGAYAVDFAGRNCAPVTASGGKYRAGDRVCTTQDGEDLIPAAYYTEVTK